jgi:hypothetical protein
MPAGSLTEEAAPPSGRSAATSTVAASPAHVLANHGAAGGATFESRDTDRRLSAAECAHAVRCDAIAAGSLHAEELGSDLLDLLETDLSARDRAWRILEVWRNFRPLALEQYRALRATLKTLDALDTQARVALKQAGISPPQADDPAVVVDGDRDRLNEHIERLAEARDATRT